MAQKQTGISDQLTRILPGKIIGHTSFDIYHLVIWKRWFLVLGLRSFEGHGITSVWRTKKAKDLSPKTLLSK
jgi:hypothetical protein